MPADPYAKYRPGPPPQKTGDRWLTSSERALLEKHAPDSDELAADNRRRELFQELTEQYQQHCMACASRFKADMLAKNGLAEHPRADAIYELADSIAMGGMDDLEQTDMELGCLAEAFGTWEQMCRWVDDAHKAHAQLDVTNRGFGIIKFVDRYGETYSLQESSLATERAIWLGPVGRVNVLTPGKGWKNVDLNEALNVPKRGSVLVHSRMHLTQPMAEELIGLLQHFVEHGGLPETLKNTKEEGQEKYVWEFWLQSSGKDHGHQVRSRNRAAAIKLFCSLWGWSDEAEGDRIFPHILKCTCEDRYQVCEMIVEATE